MKKNILVVVALMCSVVLALGQTTFIDINGTESSDLYEGFGGTEFEIIANPDAAAGYDGAQVMKVEKGTQVWAGSQIHIGGKLVFSSDDTTADGDTLMGEFTMWFYSDQAQNVGLNLSSYPWGPATNYTAVDSYKVADVGTWQQLHFVYYGVIPQADGGFDAHTIALNMDPGCTGCTGGVYANVGDIVGYFDLIQGVDVGFEAHDPQTFNLDIKVSSEPDLALTAKIQSSDQAITLTQSGDPQTVQKFAGSFDITPYIYSATWDLPTFSDSIIFYDDGARIGSVGFARVGQASAGAITWSYGKTTIASIAATPSAAVTIDGLVGADEPWNFVPANVLELVQQGELKSTTSWQAVYSLSDLYIMVTVEDNLLYNDDASAAYNNDCVELFIDMDGTDALQGETYNPGEYQIRQNWGQSIFTGKSSAGDYTYKEVTAVNETVSPADGSVIDAGDYTNGDVDKQIQYEFQIPWTFLSQGFVPLAGALFKLEVASADDFDGAGRNGLINWASTTEAYFDLSGLAEIKLGAEIDVTQNSISTLFTNSIVSFYPNPANNNLYIKTQNVTDISIYNVLGAKVLTPERFDQIDISALSGGVYLISITNNGITKTSRFIKK